MMPTSADSHKTPGHRATTLRNWLSLKVGKWVLGYLLSILLTALIAFILGAFGGAYLEVIFTGQKDMRWGYLDATLDFTRPRTFRAYYGNYHNDTRQTEIIDAIFTLREGVSTGKFTGKKVRQYDSRPYTLTGFINGVDVVLTQRGDEDAHGEAMLIMQISQDYVDKHQIYVGYQITEDQWDATSAVTLKKCPLIMIDEEVFQKVYKSMDRIKDRYHFLDTGCEDFFVPEPFGLPK